MTLNIYRTIVHSTRSTSYAYVCASSKKQVAIILNKSLGDLNKYGCSILNKDTYDIDRFKHLKSGEVVYEPIHRTQPQEGMSSRDLHKIAALGYIDAALQALNQCEMPNQEMSLRIGDLRGQLKDLKGDAKELLEQKYGGCK